MKRKIIVGLVISLLIYGGSKLIVQAASHVHTAECYTEGTAHIHSGESVMYGGCYMGNKITEPCGAYVSDNHLTTFPNKTFTCPDCGVTSNGYKQTFGEIYYAYPYTDHKDSCVTYYNYDTDEEFALRAEYWQCDCGYYLRKTYYINETEHLCSPLTYELSCGKTEGAYYRENGTIVSPICDRKLIKIQSKNSNQTIIK